MSEYSPTASIDNYHIVNLQAKHANLLEQRQQILHQLAATKQQLIRITTNQKQENQFLRDELRTKEQLIIQLKEQLLRLRKDLKQTDKVLAQNQKLKRANGKLKSDNQNMEEQIDKMKNQRRMLYDKVEAINRSIKEADDKLKRKEGLLEDSQKERWVLERSNSELKLELQQMSKDLEMKLQKIDELQQCIQCNLQNQLSNANSNGKLIHQINELTELKAVHSEKINQLEEQNGFLRQKMEQFEQQLRGRESEARTELSDLEGKMIDIKNVIETIGIVTQKTKTVRETKLRIQKDVRAAISNLQKVIRSND